MIYKPTIFNDAQSINVNEFSRYPLKAAFHRAPSAPSTERWSLLKVTFITFSLETSLIFRTGNKGRLGRTNDKDARLWGIDDGSEMGHPIEIYLVRLNTI